MALAGICLVYHGLKPVATKCVEPTALGLFNCFADVGVVSNMYKFGGCTIGPIGRW
jgi:hypothetical protein